MDKKTLILAIGASLIGTAIGALTGLGLSVTAFSPLAIGGIVGSIIPAAAIFFFAGCLLCKSDGIDSKKGCTVFSIAAPISAAIGVGLAAAATTISPGVMLGARSAVLAGATIGAIAIIAPIAGFLIADKVNDYIISPIVEHFSSKGKEESLS
ncbi:hypothetical protein [Wolbachia endosymbiont (group A) of Conops quadrifasciatus]|uniref:hypothetical protein n=1 Tax=Wolbachia endosymbiont (group A) of Conops quadrifasciatus TaxID=3066143 RepID=UPI0031331A3B